ncbi:ABC transporter permease [Clostridium paraputrificum]|uniref:ABC transporter permease n=1 Tax=Clostridium paraputrificum TaxID=29363 RepID=UPI003D32BE7B
MKKKYLLISLIILSFISLFIGATNVGIKDLINGDIDKIQILLISRLPRVVSIIIAGMGLSVSGIIMQQISRNKFTSPTTAGTMDSAKFGILIAMIVMPKSGVLGKATFAFIFALIGSFIFMTILRKIKVKNVIFVPLVGLMFGNLISSMTSFISYSLDMNQSINAWFQGSFSTVMKGKYELLYLCIPLMIIAFLYANKFTIAGMGKNFSTNLGLNHERIVNIGLSLVSAVAALTLVMVGNIPFLGLIVPNIVSMTRGDNLKNSLLETCLFGAVFVLVCDIFGRVVIAPYEVSIGLTVGVIGSIIFLYLVMRRKSNAA